MTRGDAWLVPLRNAEHGYTVFGEAWTYPPTTDDLSRTSLDWARRMNATGAQLVAEQMYVLVLALHLTDPSQTARLQQLSLTYTQDGARSGRVAMGEIRVQPEGLKC